MWPNVREINLTIIGDRACGTTRAYLTYLAAAGFRPRALWLVDFFPAPHVARRVRSIPLVGLSWANRIHRGGRPSGETMTPLMTRLCDELQAAAPQPIDFVGDFDFAHFAGSLRNFVAEDFDDPFLQNEIIGHCDQPFLYTNGGIVPKSLLAHPEVRILHIHPGIVPQMRGSDCLLWSCHRRGRLGASCFYMASGIDEGHLIRRTEFAVPDLSCLRDYLTAEHEDTVYRALSRAFDPHIRAMLFAEVVADAATSDLGAMPAEPQEANDEPAYLWMHPRIRLKVLRDLVAKGQQNPNGKLETIPA